VLKIAIRIKKKYIKIQILFKDKTYLDIIFLVKKLRLIMTSFVCIINIL